MEPTNENIKGRDIILEDLREKCLYAQLYSKSSTRSLWWQYMDTVHSTCYDVINEGCSQRAHQKLGLDYDKTMQCVRASFSQEDWGSNDTTNTLIEQEIEYWKIYGSGNYPAVVINNRTYRG